MLISIITPTSNSASYFKECLDSVRAQGPNVEHIIIDNASTDGTLDILNQAHHSNLYWLSEPDGGQANAINKGLKIARGEVVCFLNADDYFLPGSLGKVASQFSDPTTQADLG